MLPPATTLADWAHAAVVRAALALQLCALAVLALYGVHRLWLVAGALRGARRDRDARRAAGLDTETTEAPLQAPLQAPLPAVTV